MWLGVTRAQADELSLPQADVCVQHSEPQRSSIPGLPHLQIFKVTVSVTAGLSVTGEAFKANPKVKITFILTPSSSQSSLVTPFLVRL